MYAGISPDLIAHNYVFNFRHAQWEMADSERYSQKQCYESSTKSICKGQNSPAGAEEHFRQSATERWTTNRSKKHNRSFRALE